MGKNQRGRQAMRDSGFLQKTEGYRRVRGGEQRGYRAMGIKGDTCGEEHWVFYANNESLNTASKTKHVIYGG